MRSLDLFRLLREAPVTVLCVSLCAVLFLLTTRPQQSEPARREALHRWGAVVEQPFVRVVGPRMLFVERDLRGPISLWEGQWWRVPVCAFHHIGFSHLLINGMSAVFLGALLERYWGSRRMLLFLPFAATIPMLCELLLGNYVLGFSGIISAWFGVLCVLRYRDENLHEELPEEAVHLGGALLAAGVLISVLDLVPVANLAHMTGFFYGALAGCVTTGLPWGHRPARLMRVAVITLTALGLWLVVRPVWDGHYRWYLALKSDNPAVRYAELQRAVQLRPSAIGAWRNLADEELRRGEPMTAWKTLLVALSRSPSDPQLLISARRVWRKVILDPGRPAAEQTIREVFGDLAWAWEAQFREESADGPGSTAPLTSATAEIDPVQRFPLNQRVNLALPELQDSDELPPRIPPEGDAVEGRRM